MTVTSLSFALVTTYAPQKAQAANAVERKTPPPQDDDAGCGNNKRPASRQNRLADAMMSALRELGFGGTAAAATPAASTTASTGAAAIASTAATTAATPAKTDAGSTADASASIESAVQQFAHALFQVLRQSGSGSKVADDDSGRVAGHGHHRHQHRRHGEGQAYGDMSQRLEALSQTVGKPPAASPSAPGASTSLSLTLSVDDGTADAPAVASATQAATTTVIAAPVATPAKNPLLDAFTQLFNTLKPAATGTSATTPVTDMAEKLRLFLHTLAQAVAPDTMGSVQRAQVGGLVNVTA